MQAVARDSVLLSPSVGEWRPAVSLGTPLSGGLLLGALVRAGRPVQVYAPRAISGVAVAVAPAGRWVEHGDPLLTQGEGTGAHLGGAAESARPSDLPEGAVAVRADTDGTVYLRPDPTAALFAPEGHHVGARDTLALVEVMKTFTPVRAPFSGTVVRVLVDDTTSIAANQILFWLVPT